MKKALILGLGSSGKAAARLLKQRGFTVFGSDDAITDKQSFTDITFYQNGAFEMKDFDLFVPSPGISHSHPMYQAAIAAQVPIKGEVEIGLSAIQQFTIGITGTNGKTTVVKLIEHIINHSNRKAKAIGNIGYAVCDYALDQHGQEEIAVIELSSYQLETMHARTFDMGVVLNITPDHLDRYDTMLSYAQTKCYLQELIKPEGKFIIYEDIVSEYSQCIHRPAITYSSSDHSDYWVDNLYFKKNQEKLFQLPSIYENFGSHDRENALIAWMICSYLGISNQQFLNALQTFSKPSHRIEWVKNIDGVDYFDDSKGTNIDAVIKAVNTMKGSVILIAGGVDKKLSFLPWKIFQERVKKLIAIGACKERICEQLEPFFEIQKAENLEEALWYAQKQASQGDCVLLSPGCSSFDMFRDYAHRGDTFKHYVNLLEDRRKKHES